MNTLRAYERDRSLPAAGAEFELCVPSDEELLALVRRHLALPGAPRILAVTLRYARWKPGISTTSAWEVRFACGAEETVTLKRFLTGKDRHIAEDFHDSGHEPTAPRRLRPFAVVPDAGLCLWTFPADRILRGSTRVLDMRRTARIVDESAVFAPGVIRLRPTRAELIRYKPERRAVFRLDAKLRSPGGEHDVRRLGIRVLPPALAAEIAANRGACAPNRSGALTPELVVSEPRTGILVEEWLEGDVPAPDSFEHAAVAGAALARLHALEAAFPTRSEQRAFTALLPLFEIDAALLAALARVHSPEPTTASAWTHGDFHPDQILLRAEGGARLLDLDGLTPGDPVRDLASWIADRIVAAPHESFEEARGALLDGYASANGMPKLDALARETGYELVHRAAAALRRLELGAVNKACLLLEYAGALAPTGAAQP